MKKSVFSCHSVHVILLLLLCTRLSAQSTATDIDYNQVYRSALGIGVEAQFSTPLSMFGTDYQGDFSSIDVSALGRFSPESIPQLQPLVRLGVNFVDSTDTETERYKNTRFYLTGGLGYTHKFSKVFEIGGDLEFGYGYAVFPDLNNDNITYGAGNLQASLGGRVAFNPTFNLSIDLHPTLRYFYSLSPLVRFNGFSLSVGISAHYRFGTDPDDPKAEIRSLEFNEPRVDPLFAALQIYYIGNSFGEVTFRNIEKYPLTDVKISFFQPGYMNLPTHLETIDSLESGEERTIEISAAYDERVFGFEGVKPLTGEIQAEYSLRNRTAAQVVPVSYELYDKNSLTWDDDRKVSAFMTSGDSALVNYISFIRQSSKDMVIPGYSDAIQTAMQVYFGLTEIGCLYQRDPTLSFEDAQGDTLVIDSVNLPRESLTKLTGDCDDLTVLFNSMLEAAGIETGFVTVPGHIYSIFNSGIPARDYKLVHPEKSMTVVVDGTLWVPVEITFIGEDDFSSAWRAGAEEFNRFVDEDEALGLYFTRDSQTIFTPVVFDEKDLGLQYGDRTRIASDFRAELDNVTGMVMDQYEQEAETNGNKRSYNSYGIVCARFESYDRAERAFNNALALDRNYVSPKVNLANVYYLRGEFQNALRLYHDAERVFQEAGREESSGYARVLLNISRTYYELESFDLAAEYSELLAEVNPAMADKYAYLADSGGGRAADVSGGLDVQFVED